MELKEKVAYLKGLAEGLGLDTETKEGKILTVIIETLSDMAAEIEELGENALDIGEELDAISDDLAEVEDFIYNIDDDDFGDYLDFGDDDEEEDDDDDFGDDFDDDECDCEFCKGAELSYDVKCPACGAKIHLEESDLANESVKCAACGEELEFDFDEPDDEDFEDGEEIDLD